MQDESTIAAGEGRDQPLAGQQLADARRLRKLSLNDIANELHLDPAKVVALEENRFQELGAPVFVKGYLRKYAEIVGIAADPVLAGYRQLDERDEAPPIVPRHRATPREASAGPWLAAILVLALAAGGLWVWTGGDPGALFGRVGPAERPAPAVDRQAAEGPATAAPAAAEEPALPAAELSGGQDDAEAGSAPAAAIDAPADAPADPAAAPATSAMSPETAPGRPAPGEVALVLAFSGDCWTEVSDAAGDRLFFGLGKAGDTVSVTGVPPLQVLLGNFAHATLTVNGVPYPVPAAARRGETARLTIRGDASP